MPILIVLGIVLVLALVLGPNWWIQRVLREHQAARPEFPGTGAELARHLLDRFDLQHVAVEQSPSGDHYDPAQKKVRLSEPHFAHKSLAAVVIAAHEVGHAIQDAHAYRPLQWRSRLVYFAYWGEKIGSVMMFAIPVIGVLARSPIAILATYAVAVLSMSIGIVLHLVTLPVEFDASFRRALPLLHAGQYIDASDLKHARRLLWAAALTYVAQAMASLLNFMRWIQVLRR